MAEPYLSIIIPAFNEESRIGPSLDAILLYVVGRPNPVEIIVVDDGSTDGTSEVARQALAKTAMGRVIINESNRGKGYSIRRGVLAARADLVLVSDADLSTPIEDAERLMARMGRTGRGIVIGSRAMPDSRVLIHQNPMREIMGKVFNRIVRLATGLPFHDTQCGFKLMSRRDVGPIFSKALIDGFSYDVELLYVAMRRGVPIEEVGVTWCNAPGSKVGILSDPVRMLRDVLRVRRWYAQGRYAESPGG